MIRNTRNNRIIIRKKRRLNDSNTRSRKRQSPSRRSQPTRLPHQQSPQTNSKRHNRRLDNLGPTRNTTSLLRLLLLIIQPFVKFFSPFNLINWHSPYIALADEKISILHLLYVIGGFQTTSQRATFNVPTFDNVGEIFEGNICFAHIINLLK